MMCGEYPVEYEGEYAGGRERLGRDTRTQRQVQRRIQGRGEFHDNIEVGIEMAGGATGSI